MMSAMDFLLAASDDQYHYDGLDTIESKTTSESLNSHGDALDAILLLAGHSAHTARFRVPSPKSFAHSNAYETVHAHPSAHPENDKPNYRRSRAMSEPWSMAEYSLSAAALRDVETVPDYTNKYADIINKNGRIGIYTKEERLSIIRRFQAKRARRVWQKKIRYTCRKSLADRRLRVKGRFVKIDEEDEDEEMAAHGGSAGDLGDGLGGGQGGGDGGLNVLASLLGEYDDNLPSSSSQQHPAGSVSGDATHPMTTRRRPVPATGHEEEDVPYKRVRRHSIAF